MKKSILITHGFICITAIITLVALAGCSGGDGGSSNATPPDNISSNSDTAVNDANDGSSDNAAENDSFADQQGAVEEADDGTSGDISQDDNTSAQDGVVDSVDNSSSDNASENESASGQEDSGNEGESESGYTVGGTISGLTGSGLVLRNNGGDDLVINSNGTFTFSTPLADGAGYNVIVATAPTSPDQFCNVYYHSGTIDGANETGIEIACFIGAYNIVDTDQEACYDSTTGQPVACTGFGYDADYDGNQPDYTVSADGAMVTDNVTGLVWTRTPDTNGDGVVNADDKMTLGNAEAYCSVLNTGGFQWRLPTIKELYSLILFTGEDPSGYTGSDTSAMIPFMDDSVFEPGFGDTSVGERIIDGQYATTTTYISPEGTIFGADTMFGVNFVDGRIKGYPYNFPANNPKTFYILAVAGGNTAYGENDFVDNGDGTVSDRATGLMWTKNDYHSTDFDDAVSYCEASTTGGYSDWRLPDVKELQSIVDYSRAPDATNSAAIDPIFNATAITNEGGKADWGYYWASTTHASYGGNGANGTYVSFGRALGYFNSELTDVHGAGAQRSNNKSDVTLDGTHSANVGFGTFYYKGPQGDITRVDNMVRCVRNTRDETSEGYTLYSPLNSTTAYLIDKDGNTVHAWSTGYRPGLSVYFLENGELLHTGNLGSSVFNAGGAGGIVQTLDWDGNVTWEYRYADGTHLLHHDVEMLPNGNVLMIAWEYKSQASAVAAGRDISLLDEGELWPDSVIEVMPTGPDTGQIVWEWHVWDHLVQDYDGTKANYGVVTEHPERVDLNYAMNGKADWNHINAVDYNEEWDQVLLSVHNFSEIWVIDHSTTTEEAAGHSGGKRGMGGDLLYRWGNPQTYGRGTAADQHLFAQHDAEWIETGYPGESDIIIFNNGTGRPGGNYSSIEEIVSPLNGNGTYDFNKDSGYGPAGSLWSYIADPPTDFYAQNISGQQRLANGNTLICNGPAGYFFEVTDGGEIVWEHTVSGPVFRVERYTPEYPGFNGTSLDNE